MTCAAARGSCPARPPAVRGYMTSATRMSAHAVGLVSRGQRDRTQAAATLDLSRACRSRSTYWYLEAAPELLAHRRATARRRLGGAAMSPLAPPVQAFFTDRLSGQRHASPHTIASYRDTLRLLFDSCKERTGRRPGASHRGPRRAADRRVPRPSRKRARQQRPDPQHPPGRDPLVFTVTRHCVTPSTRKLIARVLAIPPKRSDQALVTYLDRPRSTRCSRRLTARPGPAGATTRCYCLRSRPGCASPS